MKRIKPLRMAAIIFALSVFLSGCGMALDREVTFYEDEAWKAEMRIGISNEMVALAGSTAELEEEMRSLVAEMEQAGAKASWKSKQNDTGFQYDISVEGDGLPLLSDIVFGSSAQIDMVEVNGRQAINFNASMTGDILGASQNIVTIHGGEVLDSNGTVIDSGTVQWINPTGTISATLTPKGGFGLGSFLVIALLAAAVGGIGWYFWKQTTQKPVTPTASTRRSFPPAATPKTVSSKPVTPLLSTRPSDPPAPSPKTDTSVYCVFCGEKIAATAKFCPHCGNNQMISSE